MVRVKLREGVQLCLRMGTCHSERKIHVGCLESETYGHVVQRLHTNWHVTFVQLF
jgi:hypothetical protein